MSISTEVKISPETDSRKSPALERWRPVARKLLRLPVLRLLKPAARQVAAVAAPTSIISVRHAPGYDRGRHCNQLTVLSANLWHDWPLRRHSIQRLEKFVHLVETHSADLLLLQEVARTSDFRVDEWLAERLGMAYVYSRANGHSAGIGFEEGLAVYSRFPLVSPRIRHLGEGANPFVRRLALGVKVASTCGEFLTFSVHLGLLGRQNDSQLADLQHLVAAMDPDSPVLIGGDFNAHETTPQIRRVQTIWLDTFRALHPHADGTTHELRWPWGGSMRRSRLDYIFLRPGRVAWQVQEVRHLDSSLGYHSDHRAVLARFAPAMN